MIITMISLLLFTTVTDVEAGALVKCQTSKMPYGLMRQMRLFAHAHRYMNLTLDCRASIDALYAAELIVAGQATHVDNSWCQFSRLKWDAWPVIDYMSAIYDFMDEDYLDMPWDKIKRTAQLHPNTIYGCAYRTINALYGIYIVSVCIYKRRVEESRCFCN